MANVKVILYDGKTQFNDVPVSRINAAWGDEKYVLVYNNDVFSGIAQPMGLKSLEEWQQHFQQRFEEAEQDESQPSQLDRIEAAVNKTQQDIVDEYTLQLIQEGIIN